MLLPGMAVACCVARPLADAESRDARASVTLHFHQCFTAAEEYQWRKSDVARNRAPSVELKA